MLSGSSAVIKYLLFIFNFIFVITGIAILTVGVVIQIEYSQYEGLLDDSYYSTPALLIAIGVIIFIVAFFGCCGSVRENYCMVLTFASLMIMIFILELAAGIAGYTLKDRAETVLRNGLQAQMQHYNTNLTEWTKQEWDNMQHNFACCGVDKPEDWVEFSNGIFNATVSVPDSCCIDKTNCNRSAAALSGVFKVGCLPILETEIKDNAVKLGGAGIGIAVVQLMGVILSCALAKGIKQGYETV